ncbi:MAG: hypothetical protein KTR31_30940 [Myxococcales bacterium]|nr:hypothetical protein [Myxococcales bacterium]
MADDAGQRLDAAWRAAWPGALACWSRLTRLSDPIFVTERDAEKAEGLTGSFAMIRLSDHAVVVSLRLVERAGLQRFAKEILAHEIGHHVYCPADLSDHARLVARMRAGLPTKEQLAPFIANLYADLLINDRLQRANELDMAGVYRTLGGGSADALWTLYMRIYEILWAVESGQLAHRRAVTDAIEGDAQLGARLIRSYRREWLAGAGRFACLCLPYLLQDDGAEVRGLLAGLLDTVDAGADGVPDGLVEMDADEISGAIHPSEDAALAEDASSRPASPPAPGAEHRGSKGRKNEGQYRGPIEYRELLESLGTGLSPARIVARYYRERARPHLVRFPSRRSPDVREPVLEGLEPWDFGQPLSRADWFESVITSPVVIPGVTTVARHVGEAPGPEPAEVPLDLYVGIDCSGSMPDPATQLSYPVLAGTILALSALRAGARVKVVLSGESPGRAVSTRGFVRDEDEVLDVLTEYLGTGYAFGIHRLRDTFGDPAEPSKAPTHVVILTDQDIFSMLDGEHAGELGWDIARDALHTARGGGTFVLHMPPSWRSDNVERMVDMGYHVHRIHDWSELVAFARAFGRATYEEAR